MRIRQAWRLGVFTFSVMQHKTVLNPAFDAASFKELIQCVFSQFTHEPPALLFGNHRDQVWAWVKYECEGQHVLALVTITGFRDFTHRMPQAMIHPTFLARHLFDMFIAAVTIR